MAARAIVGIILGILFTPVIFILLTTISYSSEFANWFWSLLNGNLTGFMSQWVNDGMNSMVAPILPSLLFQNSLIEGIFTSAIMPSASLLAGFLPSYLAGLITWTIVGVWAGAVERSAKRAISVGAGVWLGWLIIELIFLAVTDMVGLFFNWLLAQLLTLMVVILIAAIFGAMTRSEEF